MNLKKKMWGTSLLGFLADSKTSNLIVMLLANSWQKKEN
jgi:hypothetical protein